MDHDEAVRSKARALGFDLVGVAAADVPLEEDFARYEAFVASGKHGTMGWLADNAEVRRRLDTDGVLEGARSVVCVGASYAGEGEAPGVARGIARYARGQDYHNHVRRKLRKLAAFLRTLGEGVRARPMTDDAPVLEKAWAARAGLGFVGKNGLLIAPGLGSYVLLGEVVTTLPLRPDVPIAERCGSCTRCLDACPTDAFERPFVLDARRCISYLTIELRGEMPEPLRDGVGEHLFGCDVCQEVCPWNRTASARHDPARPYAPLPRWAETTLEDLAALDEAGFAALAVGSPVKRATHAGLVRNAVTVLANLHDPRYMPLLDRLRLEHPDPAVRAHAAWAVQKIGSTIVERERESPPCEPPSR